MNTIVIIILIVFRFASDRFYVINLETSEVQQIKRTDPSKQPFYESQLCGTLIAYREYSKRSALRVIDASSGNEILNIEIPDSSYYCLMKDQVRFFFSLNDYIISSKYSLIVH